MAMNKLEERLVQATRDLILMESTDSRPEERRRCFQWIRNHLEEVPELQIDMFESDGYESMLVRPRGITHPKILCCAHLDVVEHPEPDSYRSEVRDGRIYGPGAGDMKGALAILLEITRSLLSEHRKVSYGLVITSDEERGGENGLRYLVEEVGLRCEAAIVPDGGSLRDVIIEEKGIMHLRLTARGVSAHAARPWLGENPLERLSDRLKALRDAFADLRSNCRTEPEDGPHWFPTCSVTVMSTQNESPNRIPETATAVIDVRFPTGMRSKEMLAWVRGILGSSVEVEPIVVAEPTHLAPDPLFVEATREVTGEKVHLFKACGGSDSRFLAVHDIPVMLSRPLVGNLHGRDEWIDIRSMATYHDICRRYITRKLGLA